MIERARFYRNGETDKTLDIRLVTGRCAFRQHLELPSSFQDLDFAISRSMYFNPSLETILRIFGISGKRDSHGNLFNNSAIEEMTLLPFHFLVNEES